MTCGDQTTSTEEGGQQTIKPRRVYKYERNTQYAQYGSRNADRSFCCEKDSAPSTKAKDYEYYP